MWRASHDALCWFLRILGRLPESLCPSFSANEFRSKSASEDMYGYVSRLSERISKNLDNCRRLGKFSFLFRDNMCKRVPLLTLPRKIKTIQHASLLYSRAVENRSRYQGRTRTDFDVLHQSIHEFRGIDRSDQHTQEIDGADLPEQHDTQRQDIEGISSEVDTTTLLTQLMAEVSSNLDEQGAWSQWWPPVDEIALPETV